MSESKQEMDGQRERIRSTLRITRGLLDAVESFLDAPIVDVEAAQNVGYSAIRLVGEVARLYQMQWSKRPERWCREHVEVPRG